VVSVLIDLKVDNLQIRSARAGEKPAVEKASSDADPTYKVIGTLTAGDDCNCQAESSAVATEAGSPPGSVVAGRARARRRADAIGIRTGLVTDGHRRGLAASRLRDRDIKQRLLTPSAVVEVSTVGRCFGHDIATGSRR
jgi:hypothetical protein